jgi:hypothetical protein
MTTYQAEQIRRFLKAVDKHLQEDVRLVVIGGGAALLQDAVARAQAELGFAVPIGRAAIADLPLHYEDRQLRPLPRLRHLDVIVPDRHDLALSKLVRASQADLAVCKEMHAHKPFELATLVKRHLEEMDHAIGRQADRDQNLIAAVEFIWDATSADLVQLQIDHHRAAKKAERAQGKRRTGTPRKRA